MRGIYATFNTCATIFPTQDEEIVKSNQMRGHLISKIIWFDYTIMRQLLKCEGNSENVLSSSARI